MEQDTGLVSDIHFSPSTDDEFMWNLFPVLEKMILENKLKRLYVLGDLTKHKTNHSAYLVNRTADGFKRLALLLDLLLFVSGNHDGYDAAEPYWKWLGHLPNTQFITKPTVIGNEVFLPHTRDPLKDWEGLDFTDKYVFAHLTVNAALAETGQKLISNVDSGYFDKSILTFSGDVHVPQEIGPVIYIGAPYHTNFGCKYDGGAIIAKSDDSWRRVSFSDSFPRRHNLDIHDQGDIDKELKSKKVQPNDQVKLRVHIDSENLGIWRELLQTSKDKIAEHGALLGPIEFPRERLELNVQAVVDAPEKAFADFTTFCEKSNVDKHVIEFAKEVIERVK